MAQTGEKEKLPSERSLLDRKDIEILKLLQHNARITIKEISARIHLSTTPIHERIKRMEENGVIRQYATLLDHEKIKKGLTVICFISLKQHGKHAGGKFIKAINELAEVMECFSISGDFDFMLKVVCADMNAYYDFHVNKLSQIGNMGHIQSTFVMGIIKQTHQLVL